MPDTRRAASALSTAPIGITAVAPATAIAADGVRARAPRGAVAVSTKVFHAPQPGHWPAHFGEDAAHSWQTKAVVRTGTVTSGWMWRHVATPVSAQRLPPAYRIRTTADAQRAALAGWRFAGAARSIANVSSGPTSTTIVSPGLNDAWSMRSASGSSIWFWISRRNGRAPYAWS